MIRHDEYEGTLAPESYELGEMSRAERDRFELHLLECPTCLREVQAAQEFGERARAEFAADPELGKYDPQTDRQTDWLETFMKVVAHVVAVLLLIEILLWMYLQFSGHFVRS